MILAIRTDKPEAELHLYDDKNLVDTYIWPAHRQLSDSLIIKIEQLLNKHSMSLKQLTGLIVYQGPGSFTGLRIGIATANTLSYALKIPISAATGEYWIQAASKNLSSSKQTKSSIVVPEYGAKPNITAPRK